MMPLKEFDVLLNGAVHTSTPSIAQDLLRQRAHHHASPVESDARRTTSALGACATAAEDTV
jgi:hypothetical protein